MPREIPSRPVRNSPPPPSTQATGGPSTSRGGDNRRMTRSTSVPAVKTGARQRTTPPRLSPIGEAPPSRRVATRSQAKRPGGQQERTPPQPRVVLRRLSTPTSQQGGVSPRTVSTQTPPSAGQTSPITASWEVLALPATPPSVVATSAVLTSNTTTTVTTTVCRSPIMSTGLPTPPGGTSPPPQRTSQSPQSTGGLSPVVVEARRSPFTPTTMPARAIERRPENASVVLLSSDSEGEEMGGPWRTVRPGRRAKRRRLLSGGSPGGEISVVATIARASPPPPPLTPANYPELPRTPPAEGQPSPTLRPAAVRGRLSLPRTEETGGDTVGTDAVSSVAHPSAPVNVRGVMGRPRTRGTRVQASGENEAPARPVSPIGHGRARRQRGRADAQAGRAHRQPGPANAQGQRRRESLAVRGALVGRAEAVATIADLEEFAASVTNYFKEEAASTAGGEPSGASDRPRRTGRPRGRRGAEAEDAGLGGAQREGGEGAAPADHPNSGERRGGWVREAKRIQALYRRNRRRAVREVLQGPADLCQVSRQRVYQHFRGLYCGEGRLGDAGADAEPAEPATPEDVACLTDPFTEGEVDRRLRRMTNSAPGPDGLAYRDLRGADPGTRLLAALFNICVRLEVVPASWKTSNTVLVHKKGDRDDLDNWRPLALGDTMPKLFAAVLADRLTGWAVDQGKLSPAQKGFLRGEGCYEHNFALQEILTDARRRRRQAVVAWLDLSNAFGTVPHATIRRAFVRAGVPRKVIEIWRSMYDDCTTRVNTVDGFTAPIPIRSGVRQGCPLSPITFDLAIDSVLRAATAVEAGYDLGGATWAVMAYADDIALVADTPEGMKRLLAAIEDEAASAGFRFNPAKCATLHIGAGRAGRVLPTRFVLQGQTVPCLAEGTYKVAERLGNDRYRITDVDGFQNTLRPYSGIWQAVNLRPWRKE